MVNPNMRFVGVIPARFGSTRLPAKPLLKISGKPLLQWVIEGVRNTAGLSELIVATDHEEIVALADSLGVRAVMTSPDLTSGTDRVFAAAKDCDADVIFNIQGDEPLVRSKWLEDIMEEFRADRNLNMATVATDLQEAELSEVSVVKVILDKDRNGIYFSRHGIPYTRTPMKELPGLSLKHIGLYAFTKQFLQKFCKTPAVPLEKAESLEQLRALYLGERIRVLKVTGNSIGVDTPEDIQKTEALLKG